MRRACVPLLLAALVTLAVPVAEADAPFRVIVNPQVKGSQIPRNLLTSIFLKQASRWGDGRPVQPIDQSVKSSVRRAFSSDVLQQGVDAVQAYWLRQMSSGVWPPAVKASDEEVVLYVASTPGAIGYVSAATPLPDSVKAIDVTE